MLIAQSSYGLRAINPKEPTSSIKAITAYVERGPILILNDSAFGPTGYDFNGSGTPSSPYLIEGYNITDITSNLITINDTTAYFTIQNCYLRGVPVAGSDVILLGNTTHGTLTNNIITGTLFSGVYADNCTDILISNNRLYNVSIIGIGVDNSKNCTIMNNRLYNIGIYGILVFRSDDITVSGNTIYDIVDGTNVMGFGIAAIDVDKSLFSYNNISDCRLNGIWFNGDTGMYGPCNNNTILGNIIYDCSDSGINIAETCNDNIITYNTVYNNSEYGITFNLDSDDNTANWNNFMNNSGNTNPQAYDECSDNNISFNYWHDYIGTGNYTVDGAPVNNDTSPLTNPIPLVTINTPLATTHGVSTISVLLSGNALNYKYYIEGVDNQNNTWTISEDRALVDGSYTLHAYGSILTGTTHISVTFTIDASTVAVDITSPTNTTYKKNSVNLTYTSSGGVVTVYIDGTASTTALSSGSVISDLTDGSHNVTIVVADSIGNTAKDTVIFTTDTSSGISFPGLFTILLSFAILVVVSRRRKQT